MFTFSCFLKYLALLLSLITAASAQTATSWALASNEHFHVYSQAGRESARNALQWFEQIHGFFQQTGFASSKQSPICVIGFRSQADYNQYRLHATADAYYIGSGTADYIVVPTLESSKAGIAAHEYTHWALHVHGFKLPDWLNEGLAEYFSTLQITQRSARIGGDLPARSQFLRRNGWMPLSQLLEGTSRTQTNVGLFYAQSWALTEMLLLSPAYKDRFPQLLSQLTAGLAGKDALTSVYGKSLESITKDVQQWIGNGSMPVSLLPPVAVDMSKVQITEVSAFEADRLLAGLLLEMGERDRAETAYRLLQRMLPHHADVEAALGNIALQKGNNEEAREYWRKAMEDGISDADLCYRYALLADDRKLSDPEVTKALEKALTLQPDFDNARYLLALRENNSAHYASALKQLLTIKQVTPTRAYGYWSALAYAYGELGQREEAKAAATKTMHYAATQAEREWATQLLSLAETDITMHAVRNDKGELQYVTTRIQHGAPRPNPFIEPEDHIVQAQAQLMRVDCAHEAIAGVGVNIGTATLTLSIPDPVRVLMKNAPQEFSCGPQNPVPIVVEYAATQKQTGHDGVLRGMQFEKTSQEPK